MDRRRFMQAAATLPVAAAAAGVEAATMATASAPDYLAFVTGLITDWRRKDAAAVLARVTDDIAWHTHVGSPPVLGKPAMQQTLDTLAAQMNDVKWRIFSYAQLGNRFFAEGVDDFVTAEGRRVVIPYAGTLVFRGTLDLRMAGLFRSRALQQAEGRRAGAGLRRGVDDSRGLVLVRH